MKDQVVQQAFHLHMNISFLWVLQAHKAWWVSELKAPNHHHDLFVLVKSPSNFEDRLLIHRPIDLHRPLAVLRARSLRLRRADPQARPRRRRVGRRVEGAAGLHGEAAAAAVGEAATPSRAGRLGMVSILPGHIELVLPGPGHGPKDVLQ